MSSAHAFGSLRVNLVGADLLYLEDARAGSRQLGQAELSGAPPVSAGSARIWARFLTLLLRLERGDGLACTKPVWRATTRAKGLCP